MNDPIKIIWKYKNNNRKIQYQLYIFIGAIPKELENILKKIKELNLYDSFIELSKSEYNKLKNFYGKKWYLKFFNTYHVNSIINNIKESPSQKKELINKFGSEWYTEHIKNFKLTEKKLFYSFEGYLKDLIARKNYKKRKTLPIEEDTENYKTIKGGGDIDVYDDVSNDILFGDDVSGDTKDLYKPVDVQPDKNIDKTNMVIKNTIDKEEINKSKKILSFDQTNDFNVYDETIKNVFKKNYITNQYIYKDDTIKEIHNKVCCCMKNNEKFSKDSYLLPSRQYFWSEYYFNDKIEKITLGQKWIKETEILPIDIEPNNNIRVYEELRDNLRSLRDNLKRFGSKIKREDDNTNILSEYNDYINNNEIFMLDIYNELGLGYSQPYDILKNISDVYVKLYFPYIQSNDFNSIIEYLNENKDVEQIKMTTSYETILNDQLMENEVINLVEKTKETCVNLLTEKNITQAVIHINLKSIPQKINLYRLFNGFIVNKIFPFIQYQTMDGHLVYKFHEEEIKKIDNDIVKGWFENAPYGVGIRCKISEKKYIMIQFSENGKVEYKIQWKEEQKAKIEDIEETYNFIKQLIEKLNNEIGRIKIEIPEDSEFKYAFINVIQNFKLPENYSLNHNDLSEFSRYFYPYVSLEIEPKKRIAKLKESKISKFGTYLRYKRVSKYENQAKIEQRILYIMRNYEYTEQELIDEIGKQFNITMEKSKEEYDKIKSKYPNIKRSRRILKNLENLPKTKPSGISISIQGKQIYNYKIKISGTRDVDQLNTILSFLNVLLVLYVDTYLYKKKDKQILKDKLKKLVNIAHRRNYVDVVVNYVKELKEIKKMASNDKVHLASNADKKITKYSRLCQKSGNDKRRRPQQFTTESVDELLHKHYIFNKKTGYYERKISYNGKTIILKALKFNEYDENGSKKGNIYYTCNPEDNGEHFYVGYLTKVKMGDNCIPCCFKKNQYESKNKQKQKLNKNCYEQEEKQFNIEPTTKVSGDFLYILRDSNRLPENRISFLQTFLDVFFNKLQNRESFTKHYYLSTTKNGYFFKYGMEKTRFQFMSAISFIFNLNIEKIKKNIISILKKDKGQIYTSLNNGDIQVQFKTKEDYIKYIKGNPEIELIISILMIPDVLTHNGVNIIIFEKNVVTIQKALEEKIIKIDFNIFVTDKENVVPIKESNKDIIFLVKDEDMYYPIVFIEKNDELTKDYTLKKIFTNKDDVIDYASKFIDMNCVDTLKENELYTAKMTATIIEPKYQVVDIRCKCVYLITNDNLIIPTKPSGALSNVEIITSIDKFKRSFDNTLKQLEKIKLPIFPIGVFYNKQQNNILNVVAIMTETHDAIPIKDESVMIQTLKNLKFIYENKEITDIIDLDILQGKKVVDRRIKKIVKSKYENESYELFRLEFSEYLSNNNDIKTELEKIINNDLTREEKQNEIKLFIYRILDNELAKTYEQLQKGGKNKNNKNKLIHISNKKPDLSNYIVKNDRVICGKFNKKMCLTPHCTWNEDTCKLTLTRKMLIKFVNKISSELTENSIKAYEILRIGDYYVADIVDQSRFTERKDQKIIKSTVANINQLLYDLLGTEQIPKIGRRIEHIQTVNYEELNETFPLIKINNHYIQPIINRNITIIRAYVNGYYWIKNKLIDIEVKNLGYYNPIQTELSNYFRSLIIEWIQNPKNVSINILKSRDEIDTFILNLMNDYPSDGYNELYILNKIHNIPINVIDQDKKIIYSFPEKSEETNNKNIITIRFHLISPLKIPDNIDAIYY